MSIIVNGNEGHPSARIVGLMSSVEISSDGSVDGTIIPSSYDIRDGDTVLATGLTLSWAKALLPSIQAPT